jgi:hypothetical protein
MQTDTVLTDIASLAASLVAQKTLRSKAVLLGRLVPLIDQAVALGHKHEAIHSAIQSGGVDLTFGYYRNTLHRIRTRNATSQTPASVQPLALPVGVGSQEPKPVTTTSTDSGSQEPKQFEPVNPQPEVNVKAGDAFAVRNALKESQQVSQTDYRKFAKRNPTK